MGRPVVAVVGRPNVGKSTLFNRLIGRRVAIVEDTPGITRDRIYHDVEWGGHRFVVTDTGGILLNETDPLAVQVRAQAEVAMAEASAIVFVVDAELGIAGPDHDIADALRGSDRPVFLVANKADNPHFKQNSSEFYALGLGEVRPISAIHGSGVAELLDDLVEVLPAATDDDADEDGAVRLAIIGRPNVGKSSVLNAILGSDRAIVSPLPGTTRDTIDTEFEWDGQPLRLVDTAGIRRSGKVQGTVEYYMVLRAKAALERCDTGVVVVDAADGVRDGDQRVAGMAQDAGRACVIAVNKWDLVDPGIVAGTRSRPRADRTRMLRFTEEFRKSCPFLAYAPLVFLSARERFGVPALVDTAIACARNHSHRIPTGELNRVIREAADRRPILSHGRTLRIYYATMPSVRPPTIVLFCNDPALLHFSYRRYLENRVREAWPLDGTPIRIEARRAAGKVRDDAPATG